MYTAASADYGDLLALMAESYDDTGGDLIHLRFDNAAELVPMQLMMAKQWSKVLATAIDTEGQSGQKSSGKTIIPMDCCRDDWLLVMSFCYPTSPPAAVTWQNLEVMMRTADKYNMPRIMERYELFLKSNVHVLDSSPSSLQFGWKWIALAGKLGLDNLARSMFEAKKIDRDFAVAFSSSDNILNSLSPDMMKTILVTYAKEMVGLGQMRCRHCTNIAELRSKKEIGYAWTGGSFGQGSKVQYEHTVAFCARCKKRDFSR